MVPPPGASNDSLTSTTGSPVSTTKRIVQRPPSANSVADSTSANTGPFATTLASERATAGAPASVEPPVQPDFASLIPAIGPEDPSSRRRIRRPTEPSVTVINSADSSTFNSVAGAAGPVASRKGAVSYFERSAWKQICSSPAAGFTI
jgi:hypothetical protein